MIVGVVLWTLVHASEALAGDQQSVAILPRKPDFDALRPATPISASMFTVPTPYLPGGAPPIPEFSAREFRPRGTSLLDKAAPVDAADGDPMMTRTTVWQRLSQYRSHNRLQLMTLWETGGNSVSLQTGKKGDPSLQWTSRLMGHGGTHGLLDDLFSTSVSSVLGKGLHFPSHAVTADTTVKSASLTK